MINIEPLSHATLADTIQLACDIFPHDDPDKIAYILTSGLAPDTFDERMTKNGAASVETWVALDNKTVVGLTGYYLLKKDMHEAIWLNWYGVAPIARGKGLGLELLEMIIIKAESLGRRYLRLFTSAIFEEEKRAQQVYKKRGFVEFDGYHLYHPSLPKDILYFQLDLEKSAS